MYRKVRSDKADSADKANRAKQEFILTALASVAVATSLIELIPNGLWLYLINFTAGVIVLTLQAQGIFKRIK